MHKRIIKFAAVFTAAIIFYACQGNDSNFVEVPESHSDPVVNKKSSYEEAKPVAGIYENTFLAVNNKEISGVYNSDSKGCVFVFKGNYNKLDEEFTIKWQVPNTVKKGEGTMLIKNFAIEIKLKDNQGNCPSEIKLPVSKASNWKRIAAIIKKTDTFMEPEEGMETGMSFKKGDIICVLEIKNNWMRVEKIGKNTQTGWIRESDLEGK